MPAASPEIALAAADAVLSCVATAQAIAEREAWIAATEADPAAMAKPRTRAEVAKAKRACAAARRQLERLAARAERCGVTIA